MADPGVVTSLLSFAMAEDDDTPEALASLSRCLASQSPPDAPATAGATATAAGSLCKASRIRLEGRETSTICVGGDDGGATLLSSSPAVPSTPNSVMYSMVEVVPLELFFFLL